MVCDSHRPPPIIVFFARRCSCQVFFSMAAAAPPPKHSHRVNGLRPSPASARHCYCFYHTAHTDNRFVDNVQIFSLLVFSRIFSPPFSGDPILRLRPVVVSSNFKHAHHSETTIKSPCREAVSTIFV